MKFLKYAALAVFALVGIALVAGLLMPKQWSVERSLVVNAEPSKIHPIVGNLESWPKWMPWMEEDPQMKLTFEGKGTRRGPR